MSDSAEKSAADDVEVRPEELLSEPLPFSPLRRRRFPWLLAILGLLLLGAGAWAWSFWQEWNRVGVLEPAGGLPFWRAVQLPVPSFRQGDPKWRHDLLGPTPATLAAEGCALSSAAMVLSYYGLDTDPQRLNTFLNGNGGYTPQGWIYWEKAAELAPEKVRHVYEDLGSYRKIDENLLHGNPVIVKLKLPSGTTHFVVIAGKRGRDYLTQDPGAGASRGLYPLRELESKIQGLRYYERL
jgi:hypothetical protein